MLRPVRPGYLRLSLDCLAYVNVRYSANTAWTDPDFDPELPAVYYVRVLEIPTPRWTTYDAAATIQDRAYTSRRSEE